MTAVQRKPHVKSRHPSRQRAPQNVSSNHTHARHASHGQLSAFYSAGPVLGLGTPIQAKVAIGQTNDAYEREADAVASRVTGGHSVSTISRLTSGGLKKTLQTIVKDEPIQETSVQQMAESEQGQEALIQRIADDEPVQDTHVQRMADKDESVQEIPIQRQEDQPIQEMRLQHMEKEESAQKQAIQRQESEEEPTQMEQGPRVDSSSHSSMTKIAASAIQHKGAGTPITPTTRNLLEARMNTDLSGVRVHEDSAAHEAARGLNARAFTHKNHIWLGRGQSQHNLHLMAHETTHVLQQGAAVQRHPLNVHTVTPRVQREEDSLWGKVWSWGKKTISKGADWVREKARRALKWAKEKALGKIASWARAVPGYPLLTVILGRDPITNTVVERNAVNLIHGFLSLIPGGNTLFQNLEKSGTFERTFAWINAQITTLNLTWSMIKGLFRRAWHTLSRSDFFQPWKAWEKIKKIFGPPIGRIIRFARAFGTKVFQFIFEGFLMLAGPAGQQVLAVIKKAGNLFFTIIQNPIAFIGNLIGAMRKGFTQFAGNILTHLKAGLMGWLFGALAGAGLQLPEKFDLKGILSLVLQILGLTYDRLRAKLVKVIGEKRVAYLEKTFEFLKLLVTEGLAGAWKKLLEYIGSLKDMVIGAIKNWVVTKIVTAAVTKLVSMFNPAGAIIQAILAIYNTVMFFIERIQQIAALAKSVIDSVANIAAGKLEAAANYVEQAMARTIPVIISFLARLIGLGGISEKIKDIIKAIQGRVDTAITKVVKFIVKKAKSLWGKAKKSVTKGIARLREWWRKTKPFTTKQGIDHTLKTQEVGSKLDLIVQSTPISIQTFIDNRKNPKPPAVAPTDNQKKGLDEIQAQYDKIKNLKYTAYKKDRDSETGDASQTIVDTQDAIAKLIVKYDLMDMGGATEYPTPSIALKSTKITHPDFKKIALKLAAVDSESLTDDQKIAKKEQLAEGTSVSTDVGERSVGQDLSLAKGNKTGSEPNPNANQPLFGSLYQTKRHWVKGHLLNHQLGGPGSSENMTPITTKLNNDMKTLYENQIKSHVLEQAKVVDYTVTVQHNKHNDRFKKYQPQHYLSTKWNFVFKIKKYDPGKKKWIDDPASPGWTKAESDDLSHIPLTNEEIDTKIDEADASKTVDAQKTLVKNRLDALQKQITSLSMEVDGTFVSTSSGSTSAQVLKELNKTIASQKVLLKTAEDELASLEEELENTTQKYAVGEKIKSKRNRIKQLKSWIASKQQQRDNKKTSFKSRKDEFDDRQTAKTSELTNKRTVHQTFQDKLDAITDDDTPENRKKMQTLRSELDAELRSS